MILDTFKSKVEAKEDVDEELRALVNMCFELGVGVAPATLATHKKTQMYPGRSINNSTTNNNTGSSGESGGGVAGATRGFPKQLPGADQLLIQRISDFVDPEHSGNIDGVK